MPEVTYFEEAKRIIDNLDYEKIEAATNMIRELRKRGSQEGRHGGRLFIIGVGGSAANASHAVSDFRKIGKIEAYTPVDNVAELTARANDVSIDAIFWNWLAESYFNHRDILMIFSVGGGTNDVSKNIFDAIKYVKSQSVERKWKAKIIGIVGPDAGATGVYANICIKIPAEEYITPLVESFQQLIWHKIVNAL